MSEQGEEPPWADDFRRLNQAIHNYALHIGGKEPAVAVGLQQAALELYRSLALKGNPPAVAKEVKDGHLINPSMRRKITRLARNYLSEYFSKTPPDGVPADHRFGKTVIWVENYRERAIDAHLIQLLKEHGHTVITAEQLPGHPKAVHQIVRRLLTEKSLLSQSITHHFFRLRDEVSPDLIVPTSLTQRFGSPGFRNEILLQTVQHLLILHKVRDLREAEEKFLVYRNGGRPFGLLARTGWGGNLTTIHIPHSSDSGPIIAGDSGFHSNISLVRSEKKITDNASATGRAGAPMKVIGFPGDGLNLTSRQATLNQTSRKALAVIALTDQRLEVLTPQSFKQIENLATQLSHNFEVIIKLKYPPWRRRRTKLSRTRSEHGQKLENLVANRQLESLIPDAAVAVVVIGESAYMSNVLVDFARKAVPSVAVANPNTAIVNNSPLISFCRSDFDSAAEEVLKAVNDPQRADKQIERGGLTNAAGSWDEATFLDAFNGRSEMSLRCNL